MARKKSNPRQSTRKVQPTETTKVPHKSSLIQIVAVILGFYLLIAVFFSPVVLKGLKLSPAADMIAAAGMIETGEAAISSGHFPLWNPTLFCGIPMFASLQYALFIYPPEYIIRALSFVFGTSDYRIWLFHYFLAGLFTYWLARHYRCGRLASWLAGAAFAFSPQLIVLSDVGHGSKLMGMTYLPLIWLMTDRLRLKPSIGRTVALGSVFAVEILALHPQVAAYGAMLMAVALIYYLIPAIAGGRFTQWGKFALHWGGAMLLSLTISAVLWMSVLDYARHSIRGSGDSGVAGGGVTWDYATGWSFHPLESITYLFPNFMGFGNATYWGTVGTPAGQPFTHNPMYFGCVVLLLAVMAILFTKRKVWGFPVALGTTAWVLSFGKYFPILYGILFHALPFFNKFRAPVMGQVLLLLPMALLAGIGLERIVKAIKEASNSGKDNKFAKALLWIGGTAGAVMLIALVAEPLFSTIYNSFADIIRPGTRPDLLNAARELALPDVIRVSVIIGVITVLISLGLMRKLKWQVIVSVAVVLFIVDLWSVNEKLVTFTPKSHSRGLFQAEGIVKRLQKEGGKFRIHPLMIGIRPKDPRYNNANWWSYFGLESTAGYFGAKSADYQRLMNVTELESWGALYRRPQLLDALNVRYIITTVPIQQLFSELERQGWGEPVRPAMEYEPAITMTRGGAYLYRNPGEMPRARLMDRYRVVPTYDEMLTEIVTQQWDPQSITLIEKQPAVEPQSGGSAEAEIISYENEEITVKVSTTVPKLLVLADTYYPSGWVATIDGEETEILRADGVLRAVAVPAGDHEVRFLFRPKWFYAGLWISIISVLTVIAVGGFAFYQIKIRAK